MVDFDLIKGRIQKHKLSSIIDHCLDWLNEVQRRNEFSYPVWSVLALIKWAYIHTTDSIIRTPIKGFQFEQLLELIAGFEGKYSGIDFSSKTALKSSFKIFAYQQFPLQDKLHNVDLSRQVLLYLKLRSKLDIEDEFFKSTSIQLKSFLEYAYFTYFFFHFEKVRPEVRYNGDLPDSYFDLYRCKWPDTELEKFLRLLSLKDRSDFEEIHKLKTEIMQLYESGIFTTKPFILFRGQYRIAHKAIFTQTVKHFIYAYLKAHSNQFSEEFGKRLEKYVELGLKENHISYLNDNLLKKAYPSGKIADFFMEEDILMEVKAIELHPRSGVMRTRDILINDLDATIIKAYIQLLETAHKINREGNFSGIILTYKEMYLGFGVDAWNEFLKEPVEQYCTDHSIKLALLPPQNLVFISIENWDMMMQAIKSKHITLKEILIEAFQMSSHENGAESALLMEQVLQKRFYCADFTLDYLKDAYKELDILPN